MKHGDACLWDCSQTETGPVTYRASKKRWVVPPGPIKARTCPPQRGQQPS